MAVDNQLPIGSLFFVGAAQFVLAMIIAEARYPGYSIANNAISDLGVGRTARLFNASIIVFGAAIVGGALIGTGFFGPVPTLFIVLGGAGTVGVGIFPETTGRLHLRCALVSFLFGGLSAISAFSYESVPLAYYSIGLGVISLAALVLLTRKHMHGIGFGGMERMVAYPIILWALGLGGFLLSTR